MLSRKGIGVERPKSLPELSAAIERLDTKGAIIVVYLDVGDLPPAVALRYVETVKREMGNDLPEPIVWVPQRNGTGTKIVALPESDVRALYIDVGDLAPSQVQSYIKGVKDSLGGQLPANVPFLASRGGVPAIELVDEYEMNERGWYFYGVKPNGDQIDGEPKRDMAETRAVLRRIIECEQCRPPCKNSEPGADDYCEVCKARAVLGDAP